MWNDRQRPCGVARAAIVEELEDTPDVEDRMIELTLEQSQRPTSSKFPVLGAGYGSWKRCFSWKLGRYRIKDNI